MIGCALIAHRRREHNRVAGVDLAVQHPAASTNNVLRHAYRDQLLHKRRRKWGTDPRVKNRYRVLPLGVAVDRVPANLRTQVAEVGQLFLALQLLNHILKETQHPMRWDSGSDADLERVRHRDRGAIFVKFENGVSGGHVLVILLVCFGLCFDPLDVLSFLEPLPHHRQRLRVVIHQDEIAPQLEAGRAGEKNKSNKGIKLQLPLQKGDNKNLLKASIIY